MVRRFPERDRILRELELPEPRLLVGGELGPAEGDATFASLDPATATELARIPQASARDVDRAVGAARKAFDDTDWRHDLRLRKRVLLDLSRLAERDRERFALLDILDVGMVGAVARRFGARALVRNLEYFATWTDKIYGEVVPVPSGRVLDYTRREPYGVVAAVYAWNTPSLFLGSKVGPCLAAGNTIVLKPSELGSLSALHFARLCQEAGVPPGVVNVVTGGPEVGEALVGHPGVDKVTFTGGTEGGRRVQATAAARLTPVHLELGGKSPHVVLADADLDRALGAVIAGAFLLSGQACAAGTRLLLDRAVHDPFLERLVGAVKGLRVGDPLDPEVLLGPLISERQLDRVRGLVEAGRAEGAELLVGGEPIDGPGYFFAPTVFGRVGSPMRIAREEIFGPVLSVFAVDGLEDAIRVANDTPYGLAAGIWTRDLRAAHRFAEAVRAGTVWINQYGSISHTAPFGGMGRSGYGREGGHEALLEYTQVKNVSADLS